MEQQTRWEVWDVTSVKKSFPAGPQPCRNINSTMMLSLKLTNNFKKFYVKKYLVQNTEMSDLG
jgi:hypothetical protein